MPHKSAHLRHMVLSAVFAALIGVCSWIAVSIPPFSFTMQTFAIFLALVVLGGKWGSVSILLYLLLGLVGLPVFAGFAGGVSALMGITSGFLWGFLAAGLVYWLLEGVGKPVAMAAGMGVCYFCGCWWFTVYSGSVGWAAAFMTCVAPYLLFDGLKLWLAYTIGARLRRSGILQ